MSPANPNSGPSCGLDSQYVDGRDGIYRTTDGGATWTLVFKSLVSCNIVFAPDDSQLVYAVTTRQTTTSPRRTFGVVAISVRRRGELVGEAASTRHDAVAYRRRSARANGSGGCTGRR